MTPKFHILIKSAVLHYKAVDVLAFHCKNAYIFVFKTAAIFHLIRG